MILAVVHDAVLPHLLHVPHELACNAVLLGLHPLTQRVQPQRRVHSQQVLGPVGLLSEDGRVRQQSQLADARLEPCQQLVLLDGRLALLDALSVCV